MTWKKGQSGNAAGRPKGSRNRFTELRDEFMLAFEKIGGREALVNWGKDNPDQFYKLVVQMLPKERTVDMRSQAMTLEECLIGLNREMVNIEK